MKISGFTIVKNAVRYDFPVVEAIRSILPICDEVIVLIGDGDDDTENLIRSIDSPKVKIRHSVWNENLRKGGEVLADETNKAFALIDSEADWAFYIQADEVIHEKYLPEIKQEMQNYLHAPEVEGLLFNYKHFYGSYAYVGNSRRWYRREIRIVRNLPQIRSYKDAQGFRIDNRKLKVRYIAPYVYHYGWVKDPILQSEKIANSSRYWKSDSWITQHLSKEKPYNYLENIDTLELFTETHPQVMQARVNRQDWYFDFEPSMIRLSLKERLSRWSEKWFHWRPGEYRNYEIVA
ncbi:MAG: glycosyltransferase family 2 protein [Chitinophagales bacterium]|nr:glycosyltransferase family 2 protein [Bacteroidota bacterium]MCB9043844.1 glycosyltransferase family 2 protein [Chitinophagales bacterium]